jgi:hypothetical protein
VKFKTTAAQPLLIEVEAEDGQLYDVHVQFVPMRVLQDPSKMTPEGFPAFGIQGTIGVITQKKGS